MAKQTLNEFKIQYITQEKIDSVMLMGNITQDEAIIFLNRIAEEHYNFFVSMAQVQPITGLTGKSFHLKKKS